MVPPSSLRSATGHGAPIEGRKRQNECPVGNGAASCEPRGHCAY